MCGSDGCLSFTTGLSVENTGSHYARLGRGEGDASLSPGHVNVFHLDQNVVFIPIILNYFVLKRLEQQSS